MNNNRVSVKLWEHEVCLLEWKGGYKPRFGKLGAAVSFNPNFHLLGLDTDPLGPYSLSKYIVQKGLSDICRATEYDGLPRFLSGSLPDDWGNRVFSAWIEKNHLRRSDISPVDKLAFIGNRGMGALEFTPQLYSHNTNDAILLEELYSLAKAIQESREDAAVELSTNTSINDLMSVGMSAGGQHPKAIVAINWETKEVKSGQVLLPENFTQYILKFRDQDNWPTAEVEYNYYLMAKSCGITMEESLLLPVQGVNHFLTQRFDRKNGQKQHTATLQALCGPTYSYEEILKTCRMLHLPADQIKQMFRRAAFNYLTGVCDDHDKNFSFILTPDGKWNLSPAYDVTFNVNLQNPFRSDRHAMTIEECNRNITLSQFIRLADNNDISGAKEIVQEIADTVLSFQNKSTLPLAEKVWKDIISPYIKAQTNLLK